MFEEDLFIKKVGDTPENRVWKCVLQYVSDFTVQDLAKGTDMDEEKVRTIAQGFVDKGYIQQHSESYSLNWDSPRVKTYWGLRQNLVSQAIAEKAAGS